MHKKSHAVFQVPPCFGTGATGVFKTHCRRFSGRKSRVLRMFGLLLSGWLLASFHVLAAANVTLAWNSGTDPNIAGYNIYYGGASHAYTNKISAGSATSVVVSGLVEGSTYYFAATTYSAGGMESAYSGELVYLVPVASQAPTLDAINSLTVVQNAGSQTVSLSDITPGPTSKNQTLTVTAFASDTNLISNLAVHYTSPSTTGTLSFTPVANANGTAIITVTVNNGQAQNNIIVRSFTVTVTPGSKQYLIINPLTNQIILAGQTATFAAITSQSGTVTYQWKFNGLNLAGATSSALTLNHVATNQAGIYSITATMSSPIGGRSVTSQAAILTVIPSAAASLVPISHPAGQYAFTVSGATGFRYATQASTDLIHWVTLQTNTAPFTFVDTNAGRFQQRFYRSVYSP